MWNEPDNVDVSLIIQPSSLCSVLLRETVCIVCVYVCFLNVIYYCVVALLNVSPLSLIMLLGCSWNVAGNVQ